MGRGWLRHPPRIIRPAVCPTRLDRFATVRKARESLLYGYGNPQLAAVACGMCGGAHVVDGTADGAGR
jgi:hypothetical protein